MSNGNGNYSEHIRIGFSDPSPYPKVKVMGKNKFYAALLQDNYSGVISEFTAINQYQYHYFVSQENEEAAKMLENISIVEMLHMEILAELIVLLGGKPEFRGTYSTRNSFWNGRLVYYGINLCDRLKADLQAELAAIRNYEENLRRIEDPYIQEVLKRIILDEKVHAELFNKAISKYC